MNLLAENHQVITFLSNNESLISGKLRSVLIYYDGKELCIDLRIELMYSDKHKNILLRFNGVLEYALYYTSDSSFYNIER